MNLIFNASPLIAFYLELRMPEKIISLRSKDYNLLIPHAVLYKELTGEVSKAVKKDLDFFMILEPIDIENLKLRFPKLHDGELEVIRWGTKMEEKRKSYTCILDDKNARKAARNLGLRFIGTIGLLLLMNDVGLINRDEVRELCLRLVGSGFYFPEKSCYEL